MNALAQAEQMVLAGLMTADPATTYAVGNLPAEAFADPAHRALFWCLLVDNVRPDADADLAAALADVGGPAYLDELAACSIPTGTPETAIADACGLIRRCWIEREQLDAGDAARGLMPITANLVDLATWSPRGAS